MNEERRPQLSETAGGHVTLCARGRGRTYPSTESGSLSRLMLRSRGRLCQEKRRHTGLIDAFFDDVVNLPLCRWLATPVVHAAGTDRPASVSLSVHTEIRAVCHSLCARRSLRLAGRHVTRWAPNRFFSGVFRRPAIRCWHNGSTRMQTTYATDNWIAWGMLTKCVKTLTSGANASSEKVSGCFAPRKIIPINILFIRCYALCRLKVWQYIT